MAFAPRFRMGPPPRSFAADAHDCIVVSTPGSAEYKFVARDARPMASSPRYRRRFDLNERGHGARVVPSERVWRSARSRQGQVAARWPSASLDSRSAQRPGKIKSGRGDVAGPIEQGDAAHNTLDRNRPIQVQGRTPPDRSASRTRRMRQIADVTTTGSSLNAFRMESARPKPSTI